MAVPRVVGTHHIAVQVRDLALAETFYCGVLGLPMLKRWPAEGGGDRALWLDAGDGSFVAIERAAPDAALPSADGFATGRAGWHVVALRIHTADRVAWEQHLATHGVHIVHRSKWTLFIRDPEGNRLGLSHHPEDAP